METEYRVDRGGRRIVMAFHVFKEANFKGLCKQLGLKPTDMHFADKKEKK